MEMRAIEEIAIGEDLTPLIPPLAAVLHDASLSYLCSACFSTLPPRPFPPLASSCPPNYCHVQSDTPSPLYCSPNCSSMDSHLHFSSAERHLLCLFLQSPPSTWKDSSDLRLSLRLLYIFQNFPSISGISPMPQGSLGSDNKEKTLDYMERIAGLMTNRENLVFSENWNNQIQDSDENGRNFDDSCESTENVLARIREGAKMMAKAREICDHKDENVAEDGNFVLEEMVLCLVLTNAVEIQDKNGIAVYDTAFSWINHSCSPNACYRFSIGMDHNEQPPLRITPASANGLKRGGDLKYQCPERNGYGPRLIVRSIKDVKKGNEVTIAYADLLQPKEMRQAELWLKYRFSCSCKRCAAVPTAYVDYALQAHTADNPNSENKIEKLMQNIDDAITDFLSFNDPKSCCKKLENLLSHGDLIDELLEPNEAKLPQKVRLHPLHHLSLNAYTTLASAYKVQASDLLTLDDEFERHKFTCFSMYMTSSAYSLLLAGLVNHLFMSEPSLVTNAANFWTDAGESMLDFARSPLWDSFLKQDSIHFELSSFPNVKCNDCCLTDTFKPTSVYQKMQIEEAKSRYSHCIANITLKAWKILASGSHFLTSIQNPFDLSWLASPATSMNWEGYSPAEDEECDDQVRENIMVLSLHCLRYGALLSSIC